MRVLRPRIEVEGFVMSDSGRAVGKVISVNGATIRGLLTSGPDADVTSADIQMGSVLKIETPRSKVFGMISNLVIENPSANGHANRIFDIELLGEMSFKDGGNTTVGFQRGVATYPMLDDVIYLASQEERADIYARPAAANVRVGTVYPDNDLPAYLSTDDLLGKHFAVLGSTGSGKSCSTALILRSILREHQNGHVLLLDPHNEYSQVFGDAALVLNLGTLQLPYWLLNFEEIVEVLIGHGRDDIDSQSAILKTAIVYAKKKLVGDATENEYITVDTPIPYSLSELVASISGQMGKLDNPESTVSFLRLKARIEALRADRRYGFMFSSLIVQDTLGDILSDIVSIPVNGKPVTIVDLSGVPSEVVDVVVSVICRMIFDFALWSVPAQALPVLLVCEEAHRYVPADSSAGFGPTIKAISRIAMEGRKYGVSLGIISQRPSELSPNILSQCNTLFALRMSNERDQVIVRRALPENALGLLNALPSLRTQEAVVVGEGVSLPIRLKFDDLEERFRPKSGNADFSNRWQREDQARQFIDDTVDRWRHQMR